MVDQLELDFIGISDDSQESQRLHTQIALLKNAVDPADFVLMGYIDSVVPQMLEEYTLCLLYTSPSPRDATLSRMPSSA